MALSADLSLTRRCFFLAGGLSVAAAAGAAEPAARAGDLPDSTLLGGADAKTYLLVFRSGEPVMKGLMDFAHRHKLTAGHLTGIGAVSDATLGYFDPEQKTYLRIHDKDQREVLSITGNLCLFDNEPFYHVHIALGGRDGKAYGGHLFEATVRPTVELVLTAFPGPIRRRIDPATGLPLLVP